MTTSELDTKYITVRFCVNGFIMNLELDICCIRVFVLFLLEQELFIVLCTYFEITYISLILLCIYLYFIYPLENRQI